MNREMVEIVRNQRPVSMRPDTSVRAACDQMYAHRIGAVLVLSDTDRLLGIFTGRDAVRVLAQGSDPAITLLRDVMTPNPDTLPARSTAIEALRLMRDGGFRHVPVVDGDRVIGIVSRGDFRGLEQDRLDEETGLWERLA